MGKLGQVTPTLTIPAGPITPGQTAVITVSISSATGSSPAGVEWTTTYNPLVFTGTPTWAIGTTTTTAGKSLNCRVSAPGSLICIIDGPNPTVTIANGVIATISLTLSATAVPGTTPLGLTTPSAVDTTGTGITISVPACNVIDVQRFQIAATGGACKTGA